MTPQTERQINRLIREHSNAAEDYVLANAPEYVASGRASLSALLPASGVEAGSDQAAALQATREWWAAADAEPVLTADGKRSPLLALSRCCPLTPSELWPLTPSRRCHWRR
jgi:hypothetical protein